MPQPRKGEAKSAYISRCIKEVIGEGHTQDEAVGKCEGMWRTYHGAKKAIKKGKPVEVR